MVSIKRNFFCGEVKIMKRNEFIKTVSLLSLSSCVMKIKDLTKETETLANTDVMPIMFLGHGSPMNAIEENEFVTGFRNISQKVLLKPTAILCISAHWETNGTYVNVLEKPKTIHDFGGFPPELFKVQYPANGSPEMAKLTKEIVKKTEIKLDENWGLDHGAWSVIKHMYPNANVPVFQMSLDRNQNPEYHFELAKELKLLRQKGVLIVGSGNMVHNLGRIDWQNFNKENHGFDWAIEANEKMKSLINEGNFSPLFDYKKLGKSFDYSIPTPEHFMPLIYILGLKESHENLEIFNDKYVAGSLSMTSLFVG